VNKLVLSALALLIAAEVQAFECDVVFENPSIRCLKIKIMGGEEIDLHRDELPQYVTAIHGGTIRRLESNGETLDVEFPTGITVYRPADPVGALHKSVNLSQDPIELIVIQIKEIPMQAQLTPYSDEAKTIISGSIYTHYKGMQYKILSVGRNSETLEEVVVYQALYGEGNVWVRPLKMFLETITLDGKEQPRFTLKGA
jgi:hypothetical protein